MQEVAELLPPSYGANLVERFGIMSLCTKHRVLRTELCAVYATHFQ